jgi:hypothetical protein
MRLVLVGLQSDCCTQATGNYAVLKRGNRVSVVRRAHTTYDESAQGIKDGKPAEGVERHVETKLEEAGAAIVDVVF